MRTRSSSETESGRRTALDTVIGLTLARPATSLIVALRIPNRLFARALRRGPGEAD